MKKLPLLLFAVAIALVGVGFYVMFSYGDYSDSNLLGNTAGHIVGGDAYNYIIIAVRGTGFMLAGVVSALLGLASQKIG